MIETAFAQLRFAASLLFGARFSLRSLDSLAASAVETYQRFGAIGPEGREVVSGPVLDDEARRSMQTSRFRAQAVRAARETAYYAGLFERLGLEPSKMAYADIARVPATSKTDLRDNPDSFVSRRAAPVHRCTTTGTTGTPTSVCFSEYEMRSYIALAALSMIVQRNVTPEDIVLLCTSARAILGNTCFAGGCARIGALVQTAGIVDPAHTLACLSQQRSVRGKKPRVSVVSIYPSYLGQLVEEGLRLGYGPKDFGLERIFAGGEIVTEGLKRRARQLFGDVTIAEGHGMTEIWPVCGAVCSAGHLHFEPSQGLVEVLDSDSGVPSRPGEPGALVVTPFMPYRETTLVLRYDTEDMVRPVEGPLACEMAHWPATTQLLGKRRLSLRHDAGRTFPRDVAEALESVDDVPLPARFGFWETAGGAAVEVCATDVGQAARGRISEALEARGVPLRELRIVDDPAHLRRPMPLRGDLRESMFTPPPPDARATAAERDAEGRTAPCT